ncbi:hypothetical protein [Parafrankia elaeagni]|uniref:hypothetical protein n=1 Tax=Parafrankia elaeagni TaxID=222534 RepID=UPI001E4BBC12|nr:hypothetical protein [Parafrankia elaeagni]
MLDEDRHTARTGNVPLAWVIARDTAISALRLTGHKSIAKAMRATARRLERVLQIIGLISGKGLWRHPDAEILKRLNAARRHRTHLRANQVQLLPRQRCQQTAEPVTAHYR